MVRARARESRPAGFADLASFLADLEAGKVHRTPANERIARAFAQVLSGSIDAVDLAAALELRRRPGRPRKRSMTGRDLRGLTIADLRARLDPVSQFVWDQLERNPKRGALEHALNAAAERFGRDRRTVEKRWKEARPLYRIAKQLEAFNRRFAVQFPQMAALNATMAKMAAPLQPLLRATAGWTQMTSRIVRAARRAAEN